jgi:hypothetical protein
VFKQTYSVLMHPDRHSTHVTGEGTSPELARLDADKKASRALALARGTSPDAVIVSQSLVASNYENTQPHQPRKAVRNPNRDKALPPAPTGVRALFMRLRSHLSW